MPLNILLNFRKKLQIEVTSRYIGRRSTIILKTAANVAISDFIIYDLLSSLNQTLYVHIM